MEQAKLLAYLTCFLKKVYTNSCHWTEYAAAWGFFLATHALPSRPGLRPRLVAALGARGYTLAYSALSLAALGWLRLEAGETDDAATLEPLYLQPPTSGGGHG